MISKIGFIGAGKVGTSLGRYLNENGIKISGYYSKTKSNAASSADFTNSSCFDNLNDIIASCDTIFITVPDGEISNVWDELIKLDEVTEPDSHLKGKNIIHCSGAQSSRVLSGAKRIGVYAYSLHPMCSVSSRTESWQDLKNAYFTVEGDPDRIEDIKSLIKKTGNNIEEIGADTKIKYHASTVFVSNLVVGLAKAGQGLLAECGLTKDFSENAWKSLFMVNAQNMADKGLSDALTGPIERNDYKTVKKHLEILEGSDELIYKELSRMILDIAKGKHPERDYTEIDKELGK